MKPADHQHFDNDVVGAVMPAWGSSWGSPSSRIHFHVSPSPSRFPSILNQKSRNTSSFPSLPFEPSLKNTNVTQRIAGDLSWHPCHFVPYGIHTYATDEKIMILFLRSLRDLNKWIRFGGEKDNTKKVPLNDFAGAATSTVLAQATPSHNNTRHKRTLIIQHYSKNAWITLPYWDFHCCILCTESVTWSLGREGQLRRQATALNLVDDARRRTFFGACEARGLPGGSPLRPSIRPSPPP